MYFFEMFPVERLFGRFEEWVAVVGRQTPPQHRTLLFAQPTTHSTSFQQIYIFIINLSYFISNFHISDFVRSTHVSFHSVNKCIFSYFQNIRYRSKTYMMLPTQWAVQCCFRLFTQPNNSTTNTLFQLCHTKKEPKNYSDLKVLRVLSQMAPAGGDVWKSNRCDGIRVRADNLRLGRRTGWDKQGKWPAEQLASSSRGDNSWRWKVQTASVSSGEKKLDAAVSRSQVLEEPWWEGTSTKVTAPVHQAHIAIDLMQKIVFWGMKIVVAYLRLVDHRHSC